MKVFQFTNILILGALSAALTAHSSGGMDGGGGDIQSFFHGAAWYTGAQDEPRFQEIPTCILIGDGFNAEPERIKETVEQVISQWAEYLRDRITNESVDQLNFNFKFKTENCSSSALRLYFGVETPEVARAKEAYDNPVGFSKRHSFDYETGMSDGFIWIRNSEMAKVRGSAEEEFPNWRAPFVLHGMLLHEFGHIFGLGGGAHILGTIMDEAIYKRLALTDGSEFARSMLKKIDQDRELLPCDRHKCRRVFGGRVGYNISNLTHRDTFAYFVGRIQVGQASAKFHESDYTLVLEDEEGSHTIELKPISEGSFTSNKVELNITWKESDGVYTRWGGLSQTEIIPVSIKNAVGADVFGLIQRNSTESPGIYTISYLADGEKRDLFYTNLPGLHSGAYINRSLWFGH